jgi:hypothetical protein
MVCFPICMLAGVFLLSMLYVTFMVDKNYVNNSLMSGLTPQLKDEYIKRVQERRNIYMTGFFAGLIISLISLFVFRQTIPFGSVSSACFLIAVTYSVSVLYYYVTPKMTLFVTLLDKQSDRENWAKIYQYMKYNYMMSLIFGVLFVGLLGYGLC